LVEVDDIMGGGIVGQKQGLGDVRNCINMGVVTGEGSSLGLVIGQCDGDARDCFYFKNEELNPTLKGIGDPKDKESLAQAVVVIQSLDNNQCFYATHGE